MPKRSKWVVKVEYSTRADMEEYFGDAAEDYDIEDFNEIEVAVVRKNNEHGLRSGGWGGKNKIILYDDDGGDGVTQKDIDWWTKVANVICDALNKHKL